MAWQLDIHIIDVGVGDSAVIVARETTTGVVRSMLVDGGLDAAASLVHDKLESVGLSGVDVILVSHFDQDHAMGVANLLLADNMSVLSGLLADVGVRGMLKNSSAAQTIAQVAAGTAAAALGAWGDFAGQADQAIGYARSTVPKGAIDLQAANVGISSAERFAGGYGNPPLFAGSSKEQTNAWKRAARRAGSAATGTGSTAFKTDAVRNATFNGLPTSTMPNGAKFRTGGSYQDSIVIDIGTVGKQPKPSYLTAMAGQVIIGSSKVDVPNARRRIITIPSLQDEVFWSGAAPAPAGAPVAVVVSTPDKHAPAATGTVWQGNNRGPWTFNSGHADNDVSIGIILMFGSFVFFTAGDLPTQGEDPLGDALVARALPDGRGGQRAGPLRNLLASKVSHHGSSESTSAHFLDTVHPSAAYLSCGSMYNHPRQDVVTRLHGCPELGRFYLTNCLAPRQYVPASTGQNQLTVPGNKSRVAGDNAADQTAPGRHRGDITITVQEDWVSTADEVKFRTSYWEATTQAPENFDITVEYEP
jgi:beta-lactamase superfamily II metal-dependent hydrolase